MLMARGREEDWIGGAFPLLVGCCRQAGALHEGRSDCACTIFLAGWLEFANSSAATEPFARWLSIVIYERRGEPYNFTHTV